MKSDLDVLAAFPLFVPSSAGDDASRAGLTIQTVNELVPRLRSLIGSLGGKIAVPVKLDEIAASPEDRRAAKVLKRSFDAYGSDKADPHNYHLFYGHVLRDRKSIGHILEIGLGTNNQSFVSNMGKEGRPGASLRAFRDFCPYARIIGADIDRHILFEEDRIRTFFVDQTEPATFNDLAAVVPAELDLFIDDGLHSPHANLASLEFGLSRAKLGGWVVIEDIPKAATALWQCVAALLPDRFRPLLLQGSRAFMFAVQRVA